jgi:rhodanese-related sulfurtransferase
MNSILTIEPLELEKIMLNEKIKIYDVRLKSEYEEERLADALSVNLIILILVSTLRIKK